MGHPVHEIGPFMPSSSVFVEFMICAIYGPKCKHAKTFGKKSLNVTTVQLFFNFFSKVFGFFDASFVFHFWLKVDFKYPFAGLLHFLSENGPWNSK